MSPERVPTAPPTGGTGTTADLHRAVLDWYDTHARVLPWRAPGTSPWGVLVSEVMLQQTPVARVAPAWRTWMARWPGPAELAAASGADVLRAWDRLGYPRRALRLQECARAIVAHHGGVVPATEDELLALPGIGDYTAAAVLAFAHGERAVVLDTNVRRVLGRVLRGEALPPQSLGRTERELAAAHLPEAAGESVRWNVGVMELGALVCTARAPRCSACPLAGRCVWAGAGRPADRHARRSQRWQGTDRQARGRVLALLRAADAPAERGRLLAAATLAGATDSGQPTRVLASLLADGLVQRVPGTQTYRLPQG